MTKIICNCKMFYSIEIEKFVKKHPSSTFQDMVVVTGYRPDVGVAEVLPKSNLNFLEKNKEETNNFQSSLNVK
jgi:hypothetical protein